MSIVNGGVNEPMSGHVRLIFEAIFRYSLTIILNGNRHETVFVDIVNPVTAL